MKNFKIDPRYFQIAFLSGFAIYGYTSLNWLFDPVCFISAFAGIFLTQFLFCRKNNLPASSFLSAAVTLLGLLLLLRTNSFWIYAIAGALSICSKFLIQHNRKHFFNPVNFGIILTILITDNAWISPGQWGSAGIYILITSVFSMLVLVKVKQLLNGLIFLGSLFLFEFIYLNLYLGWPLDMATHKFTSGSLLLFSFFMITDPRTTPNHNWTRGIWAFFIAGISFYLIEFQYLSTAPFWVLFFISPLTPLLNKKTGAKAFQWKFNQITNI